MLGATQIPPPYVRCIIEKTAKFVCKHGLEIENRIIASNVKNARFKFLSSSDPYHAFYKRKLYEYQAQKINMESKLMTMLLQVHNPTLWLNL